nr:unnamed protein product [Callosobruchus chinensis]
MISKNSYILSKNYLAFALSETWLSDKIVDEIITVPGYNLVRADRGTRGGGVALYLRNDLIYSVIPVSSNIEQLWVSLRINGVVFALGCVYKPPTTSHTFFTDELEESLALCMLQSRHIICLGDININFLDSDSASVKYMTDMLHSIDIEQIVSQPTHITANKASLIDVILCSNPSLISSCSVGGADISDHELVSCVLSRTRAESKPFIYTYRSFKNFDSDHFYHDLENHSLIDICYIKDIDDKLNIFNSRLIGLFDKHLPIKSSRITKPKAPWLNDEIKKMMKDRDAAKSKFRKTPSTLNWDSYKNSKNRANHAISKAKRNHLQTITQNGKTAATAAILPFVRYFSSFSGAELIACGGTRLKLLRFSPEVEGVDSGSGIWKMEVEIPSWKLVTIPLLRIPRQIQKFRTAIGNKDNECDGESTVTKRNRRFTFNVCRTSKATENWLFMCRLVNRMHIPWPVDGRVGGKRRGEGGVVCVSVHTSVAGPKLVPAVPRPHSRLKKSYGWKYPIIWYARPKRFTSAAAGGVVYKVPRKPHEYNIASIPDAAVELQSFI